MITKVVAMRIIHYNVFNGDWFIDDVVYNDHDYPIEHCIEFPCTSHCSKWVHVDTDWDPDLPYHGNAGGCMGKISMNNSIENDVNYSTIYPNPNTGIVNIELHSKYETNTRIELISISGQRIKINQYQAIKNETGYTLNLSALSTGIYIYNIIEENSVIFTGKIIKY